MNNIYNNNTVVGGCRIGCGRLWEVVSCGKKNRQPRHNLKKSLKGLTISELRASVVGCRKKSQFSSKHFFFACFFGGYFSENLLKYWISTV